MDSDKRFILVLAGTQSGKTALGPHWLFREIQEKGPGDYAVIGPSFELLEKKALPEFKRYFEGWLKLGKYTGSPVRCFRFSKDGLRRTFGRSDLPCTVYFGYAAKPESLESATYKGVWCDEAGQKDFKDASWDALRRRLSIHQGRALITTTPYDLGWLKVRLYDAWKAGDPEIDVIQFRSISNPAFPIEEYEAARQRLQPWRFALFYDAVFTKPAGTIYDCFDETKHVLDFPHAPGNWRRFVGLDFGNVNTAACFLAEDPLTQRLIVYATYHTGNKPVEDWDEEGQKREGHASAIRRKAQLSKGTEVFYVGGSRSEDEWRSKFINAGLSVMQPFVSDVEVGIDSVYEAIQSGMLYVHKGCDKLINDLNSYRRELDDNGEPTEKIENKETWHRLDALRYAISHFRPLQSGNGVKVGQYRRS
jgi:hypothetical protein